MVTAGSLAMILLLSTVSRPGTEIPRTHQEQVEVLNKALRAFDDGARLGAREPTAARERYEQARLHFQSLVDAGIRNGRLLYNLGNCYMRLGQLGRAIACYRRAERLIPGDGNLAENLRFARSLQVDRIEPSAASTALRRLLFWHYGSSIRTRARVAMAAYVLFWAVMLGVLLTRAQSAAWRWTARTAAIVAVVASVSVGAETYQTATSREGVLIANDVTLRKGNGVTYDAVFDHAFSEGLEFSLVEPPRGDWLHIRLPDGKSGWIRSDQAELF
ncbi:MAG: tetratricopeptide repeat protein [Phycisphaerae bacterium]|nr:tetratricopeptide repeat protein [Phycisphaerae bacterium]